MDNGISRLVSTWTTVWRNSIAINYDTNRQVSFVAGPNGNITITPSEAMYFSYDTRSLVVRVDLADTSEEIASENYTEFYYLRNGQRDIVKIVSTIIPVTGIILLINAKKRSKLSNDKSNTL